MNKILTRKYQINSDRASVNGKTYGRVVHTGTLTTNELANHIAQHGSPFNRATIVGVLAAACDCLVELVSDSKKVQLGDLGTFYLSAQSEGAAKGEDFTADKVKKLHLRFMPNMKRDFRLDSVTMRKKVSVIDIDSLTGVAANAEKEQGSTGTGGDDPVEQGI